MKKEGPILITGTFRSGTTLISQVLRNHTNVKMVYDSVNFMRFSYERYNPIYEIKNVKKLLNEIKERISERWGMNFEPEEIVESIENKKITYAQVYNELMKKLLLTDSDSEIWGEKTTLVWTKIPAFFKMFPEGRVIHIIRDPRAVLASWKNFTNAPGNDYLDAIFNCLGSMGHMRKYNRNFEEKRYIGIRFEDLVRDPHHTAQKVCKELEIEFEEEMIQTQSFKDKSGKSWSGNSMFKDKIKGFSTDTIDTWKDELKEWEIWFTEFFTHDEMIKFNYKKMDTKNTKSLIEKVMEETQSSQLVTNGALYYLFNKEGLERFPSDPLDSKTWENGEIPED